MLNIELAFFDIYATLNYDLRQSAKIYLSGLQFIVDEFNDDEDLHEKLIELSNSASVQDVKSYIAITKEELFDWTEDSKIDITKLPETHVSWWNEVCI